MKIKVNQFYENVDCPREFICAHCGVHVYVNDVKDKRVKYCSAVCEKQYWREKSKQNAAYKKRSREKIKSSSCSSVPARSAHGKSNKSSGGTAPTSQA